MALDGRCLDRLFVSDKTVVGGQVEKHVCEEAVKADIAVDRDIVVVGPRRLGLASSTFVLPFGADGTMRT
jgi:hypothetical protein